MKFGVREICDVVFKAKATQKIGNKIFYKDEPVIYFDSLKTTTLEGAATTVYATGGRGNSRLIAWEGDRTMTFTMEDALISPVGFMILSGAGLTEGTEDNKLPQHTTEQTDAVFVDADTATTAYVITSEPLSKNANAGIYVMLMKDDEPYTEPFIGKIAESAPGTVFGDDEGTSKKNMCDEAFSAGKLLQITTIENYGGKGKTYTPTDVKQFTDGAVVLVDYYTDKGVGAQLIDITPDKFGGNFYVEASTLFRNTQGVDMPAEFTIPNAKIQSNFTFTMAPTGDPSTFTFTLDAFPDYTRFNKTKKVLASLLILNETDNENVYRSSTVHAAEHDALFD